MTVVAGFILAGLSSVAQATEKESKIEGRWQVNAATVYGKESKGRVGVIWEFQAGERVIIRHANGRTLAGKYRLNIGKKPWHIDIETAEDQPDFGGGGPRKGIVSIEGDSLTLCVTGSAAAPRPNEIVSKKGTLNILRVMKRVKDKE